jgi:predicted porin
VSVTGISGRVALDSGLSAAVNYSMIEIDGVNNDGTHWGIGAAYTFDMISVGANYGSYDWDVGALDPDQNGTVCPRPTTSVVACRLTSATAGAK